MKDQIEQLNEWGIHAISLNSSLSYAEYINYINRLKSNRTKLLYLAPETLLKQDILDFIAEHNVDGGHHKQWLIDQIVRKLTGNKYNEWIKEYKAGEDGENTYDWNEGIAP